MVDRNSLSLFVGTAGWAIPKEIRSAFPAEGSVLYRYAQRCNCAEINTTFYRSHRPSTYARWGDSVPPTFRFALKVPRLISHELGLNGAEPALTQFLTETSELKDRRGPLLVQCPPKFTFDPLIVGRFLAMTRQHYDGPLVFEPRHVSWFTDEVDAILSSHRVARVAADPPHGGVDLQPGGFRGLTYMRLHGSPRVYFSSYDADRLSEVMRALLLASGERWCIFDNTASGAAMANALELIKVALD